VFIFCPDLVFWLFYILAMNGVAVDNSQSPSAVAADSPTTGTGSTIDGHSPRQDSTTTPSDPTQTGVTDPPPFESTPTSTLHLASTGSEERREQNDTSSTVATIGDKGMVSGGENGRHAELEPVVKEEGEVTLEHANNQIELLEHASDTIVGVGEAGVVTEDGHEWLAEGDHELKRVKVSKPM
jgi:protein phosphatase-4 regulatory subunit 3